MTIGAIVGLGFITLVIIGIVTAIAAYYKKGAAISIIIGIILIAAIWAVGIWYYNGTESGKRAVKTQQSNFDGGIERKITVYDVQGDVIAEYRGKFDIEYDGDRILFDDEQGLRHIIYYPTGNVIIDEIGE